MTSFHSTVSHHITQCNQIIESQDNLEAKKQVEKMVVAYELYLPNLKKSLDRYGVAEVKGAANYFQDLEKITTALKVLKTHKNNPPVYRSQSGINIDNRNTLTNDINIDIDINIRFEEVKSEIKNNGSLPQVEIDEILKKIDELEAIYNDPDTRSMKWSKTKGFLEWLSGKGVDIAAKILPLVLESIK